MSRFRGQLLPVSDQGVVHSFGTPPALGRHRVRHDSLASTRAAGAQKLRALISWGGYLARKWGMNRGKWFFLGGTSNKYPWIIDNDLVCLCMSENEGHPKTAILVVKRNLRQFQQCRILGRTPFSNTPEKKALSFRGWVGLDLPEIHGVS